MAMTNKQIIMTEVVLHGITEEVDTYAGWLRRGRQVQRGSEALFITSIWKPCKTKKTEENPDGGKKLYLVKAGFFGLSQTKAC